MPIHPSVLLNEVAQVLSPDSNKVFIDGTLGHGGHSEKLLQLGATVIGLDQDPESLNIARARLVKYQKFSSFQDNFTNFYKYIPPSGTLSGVLLDLGLNIEQQKSKSRGFSFESETLDMQLHPKLKLTAEEVINTYSQEELFNIFAKISQEKYSKEISHEIVKSRKIKPITSAIELTEIIKNIYLSKSSLTKINPATKVLMALRIYVNQEFQNLDTFLENTLKFCPKGCIISLITFHSGEDRIVKSFFKNHKDYFKISPPHHTSNHDHQENPSSRSATLRSVTKMV